MKAPGLERKLLEFVQKHLDILFILILTVLALAIRYYGKDFVGGDMTGYFIPWHEAFSKSGFAGLKEQVGDYNIPYQVVVWLMTLVPIKPMYMYKLLSGSFDFLMAFTGSRIIQKVTERKTLAVTAYVILLFLPEVVFNSSYLGQCDAIWTSFVLLSILFLMKEKYFISFIFLGCAFAFKLQFVFIVPLFVFAWVIGKRFSVLNFVLVPGMLMALSIPAYIAGRPIMDVFRMYFFQVYQYHDMSLGFPSFWTMVGITEFKEFYKFAILLTIMILGILLYFAMKNRVDMTKPQKILLVGALTSWTCVLFLPDMHERYGYLTDILLILLCIADYKYFPFAAVPAVVSICVYFGNYHSMNLRLAALIYFIAYAASIYIWVKSELHSHTEENQS